jgi:homoserine dehydrogenase
MKEDRRVVANQEHGLRARACPGNEREAERRHQGERCALRERRSGEVPFRRQPPLAGGLDGQGAARSMPRALRDEAARQGVSLRFESSVMDGAPVFNLWRHAMPGVKVLGFTGVLNSTSKVVIETMERGGSFDAGLAEARQMGITEGDGAYDVEGWDSAAKTAALANVLMDARTTPQLVTTRGITRLTPERVMEMAREGKTVRLVSRGRRTGRGVSLRVRAEVLERNDLLACTPGTSNLILFHTDLMGTFGTVSIDPGVEQTAYGVFSDLVSLR